MTNYRGKGILEDNRVMKLWKPNIAQMLVDAGIRYSPFAKISSSAIRRNISIAVRNNNAKRERIEEILREIAFQETADLDEVLDFLFLPLSSVTSAPYRSVMPIGHLKSVAERKIERLENRLSHRTGRAAKRTFGSNFFS